MTCGFIFKVKPTSFLSIWLVSKGLDELLDFEVLVTKGTFLPITKTASSLSIATTLGVDRILVAASPFKAFIKAANWNLPLVFAMAATTPAPVGSPAPLLEIMLTKEALLPLKLE